ncbi:phospholipase D2 [Athalia rosae]|uniref:phospholipase D2 n=1 Tax=Athalia rosae TaxID=37344 RepID=UPI0020332068|nr:phospholipase D2 [Athalia rosae]XP_048513740.1 phospholipase D2 [Athalia rosae]XP_048513741.1 phospholipase D2 [Athalia rosae]
MMNETDMISNEENEGNSYNGPLSPGSEYDDDLGVPYSFEMALRNNGDATAIQNTEGAEETDNKVHSGYIGFLAVHQPPVKFKSQDRKIFIPGVDICVKIIDNERSVTTHPLNPNLYTIELTHGRFVWTIKKRYKHIHNLHNQLKIYRASLKIPFPTKSHRERRNSLKNQGSVRQKTRTKGILPRFPNKPDVLVPHEQLSRRIEVLEKYLENLLKIEIYRRHPETIAFLEVSHLTFIADLGLRGKEGMVSKRTGSSSKIGCNMCGLLQGMCCVRCSYFCTSFCGSWRSRYLIVKDSFVAYIRPTDGRIKAVILMDNGFEVSSGMYSTGLRNGLQIMNLCRQLVIKCWTRRKAKEWIRFILEVANDTGKPFIQMNPHKSFAPYRSGALASWFVDGAGYMSAVADALEGAKEEIFIADWWLSPEIFMKRPALDGDYWRLDKILERKAKEGVKVFVLIYKEVELALGINSYYSKQRLVEKCPENIKVLRHPDHARVGIFLWAHHEKMVIVDQTLGFLGGIDLCYGRWDNSEHRLTDLGSVQQSSIYIPSKGKLTSTSSHPSGNVKGYTHVLLPLAIAANTVAMATTKSMPVLPTMENPRSSLPQLKPGDPLLLSPPEGVDYFKCNTPESTRKNLLVRAKTTVDKVKYNVRMKRKEWINMVYSPNEGSSEDEDEVEKSSLEKNFDELDDIPRDNSDIAVGLPGAAKLWLGKDYSNFIVKDFSNLELPYQDLVDRTTTPRMPWHDIGTMVQGASARDLARHFIHRWNAVKLEKAKLNGCYPYLLPKSYNDCSSYAPFLPHGATSKVRCQVLRSVSSWSAGFLEPDTLEQSIHEAYIVAINNAKRYIYIENQFFITLASVEGNSVKNRIGETLLKRILRAHREGAVFRVFVIMPLLPGFEGEVGGPTGTALRAITHWNYASISRGKDAILNRLIGAGVQNPSDYITFHGLRNHSVLNGSLVTELIYVHSKLMIVDDSTVICGSANINDRSMIATRDSEVAVIIHDEEFEDGKMNGMSFDCGKYGASLRKRLFREHLGLLRSKEDLDIEDPVKKSFYHDIWRARSKLNTEIYEKVFNCIPTDAVVNFSVLKSYQGETPLCLSDPIASNQLVTKIRGHLVDLPLNFLCNEVLTPNAATMEGILPTSLWI